MTLKRKPNGYGEKMKLIKIEKFMQNMTRAYAAADGLIKSDNELFVLGKVSTIDDFLCKY